MASRMAAFTTAAEASSREAVGSSSQDQPRLPHERASDRDPLPFATGKVFRIGVDAMARARANRARARIDGSLPPARHGLPET